jgi:zearalenone synthase (highly reducing iterative type I polyketide synthase)
VIKTWDVTIASRDGSVKTTTGQEARLEDLDFSQDLPTDMPEYDLLIASELGSYALDPLQAVEGMCKVVKPGGTLCLLATDSVLGLIRPFLDASDVETTVLRNPHHSDAAPSQEPSLVIAKKSLVPHTNGMTKINGAAVGPQQVTLIQNESPTELALAVASRLTTCLEKHGYETHIFSWGSDISTLAGKSCISLLEFQKTVLLDLTADDFESIKKLLLETEKLFWVTAVDSPGAAMVDGLTRVVRNEAPAVSLRVFHADESCLPPVERLAAMIVKSFLWTGEDNEFRVKEDLLHVSRIEEDTSLNEEIHSLLPGAARTISNALLKDVEYPVKLCVQSPGMLGSLCLEPDDSTEAVLEPDSVEINVKATALKQVPLLPSAYPPS